MPVVSEKRKASRAATTGGIMRDLITIKPQGRKGTLVKDACERRKCQEFNPFGFSGRTAHDRPSAGTA
jgi:hypothetical protein